jgi:hypothetical protein
MADNASRVALLRPLGFGELFDRAVTHYVRNFVPFTTIMLVLLVPWGIVQYFIDAGQASQLSAIFDAMGHPGKAPPVLGSAYLALVLPLALLFAVLILYALNAVAAGVARLYSGLPVDVRACYRASLSRWAPTLGMAGMFLVTFLGWYISFFVVGAIFGGVAVGVTAVSRPVGIILLVLTAIVVVAMVVLLVLLLMAVGFGMYAVVIEDRGVMDAFGSGFRRVFARGELGRATLFAFCSGLLYMAYAVVVSGIALYAMYAHMLWLAVIVSTIGQALYSPFSVVLFAVYYYDIRIRREGHDLEADLQALVASPTA